MSRLVWKRSIPLVLSGILLLACPAFAQSQSDKPAESQLTGEILPVFYVADVRASVEFYRKAGFSFHHYWDYDAGRGVKEWKDAKPPVYAEMAAGPLKIGIHLEPDDGPSRVTTRHYFRVKDVEAYRKRLAERGIEVGKLHDLPWMKMFSIHDPDGHLISFFTPPEKDRKTSGSADSE